MVEHKWRDYSGPPLLGLKGAGSLKVHHSYGVQVARSQELGLWIQVARSQELGLWVQEGHS